MIKFAGYTYRAALETQGPWKGRPGENKHITLTQEGTLPTETLLGLPGKKGEMRGWHEEDGERYFGNYREEDWNAFLDSIEQEGIRDPVFLVVEWADGKAQAFIYEGNHRIQAAKQLGLEEVPVEIRYFGHAEQEISF